MREIDLTPYKVTITSMDEVKVTDYNIKETIAVILFLPEQNIKGREAIKLNLLCEKIETAGDLILLEEADWKRIVDAIDQLPRVGRNDVKFIERILNAPEVDSTKLKLAK